MYSVNALDPARAEHIPQAQSHEYRHKGNGLGAGRLECTSGDVRGMYVSSTGSASFTEVNQ